MTRKIITRDWRLVSVDEFETKAKCKGQGKKPKPVGKDTGLGPELKNQNQSWRPEPEARVRGETQILKSWKKDIPQSPAERNDSIFD